MRIYFWDNFKGILILLVVIGHALIPTINSSALNFFFFQSIYLFHMPAFVFISGYFASFVSDPKKAIAKLIIIYILFNYSMMLYAGYFQDLDFKLFEPYYSFWFIIALIAWRIIGISILNNKWLLPFSIFISLLIGFWPDVDNTLALSRIIGFFPFYVAGYQFSKTDINAYLLEKKVSISNTIWFLLTTVFLFFVSITVFISNYIPNLSYYHLVWQPYLANEDLISRVLIMLTATVIIIGFLKFIPNRKIIGLTNWGKYSLSIFVLHRFVLFAVDSIGSIPINLFELSVLIVIILGNSKVGSLFNNLIETIYLSFTYTGNKMIKASLVLFLIVVLVLPVATYIFPDTKDTTSYVLLSNEQQQSIDNAISIAYVGEFILHRRQIEEAQTPEGFDFDPIFEYAKKYFQQADYTIGVLEGPLAGGEYTNFNYEELIFEHRDNMFFGFSEWFFNYPDSFAKSIYKNRVDLVTLANNHLLDRGIEGARRTLDVLDDIGLDHTGSYRNQDEKDEIKIIEINGLEIAVLSYTFHVNNYDKSYFFEHDTTITSIITIKGRDLYEESLEQVKIDFERAKKKAPDLIMVLPHMGIQFTHEIDEMQEQWNDTFTELGADIILTAHPHVVRPVEYRTVGANTSVIVNSPGNFISSYLDQNGDATSIVKIFIDPDTKTVIGAGVIPMWTHAPLNGVHRALPIYDILHNEYLMKQLSRHELNRIKEVHALITSVMLGIEIPFEEAQNIYYLWRKSPKI